MGLKGIKYEKNGASFKQIIERDMNNVDLVDLLGRLNFELKLANDEKANIEMKISDISEHIAEIEKALKR